MGRSTSTTRSSRNDCDHTTHTMVDVDPCRGMVPSSHLDHVIVPFSIETCGNRILHSGDCWRTSRRCVGSGGVPQNWAGQGEGTSPVVGMTMRFSFGIRVGIRWDIMGRKEVACLVKARAWLDRCISSVNTRRLSKPSRGVRTCRAFLRAEVVQLTGRSSLGIQSTGACCMNWILVLR